MYVITYVTLKKLGAQSNMPLLYFTAKTAETEKFTIKNHREESYITDFKPDNLINCLLNS